MPLAANDGIVGRAGDYFEAASDDRVVGRAALINLFKAEAEDRRGIGDTAI